MKPRDAVFSNLDPLTTSPLRFALVSDEHYHSGIDLLTPSSLHYGRAQQVLDHRHQVMQAAYARHPDRFVKGCPRPKQVPPAVWINPPAAAPTSAKMGFGRWNAPRSPWRH
ncbi:MAG: hypothetical protein U0795_10840 [Pirellulales bacterium]